MSIDASNGRTDDFDLDEPTPADIPDLVTTSALIKEVRRLGDRIEEQGKHLAKLADAVQTLAGVVQAQGRSRGRK